MINISQQFYNYLINRQEKLFNRPKEYLEVNNIYLVTGIQLIHRDEFNFTFPCELMIFKKIDFYDPDINEYGISGIFKDSNNSNLYGLYFRNVILDYSDYIKVKLAINKIVNVWIKYKRIKSAKKIQLAYKNWIYKKNYLWNPYTFIGMANLVIETNRLLKIEI